MEQSPKIIFEFGFKQGEVSYKIYCSRVYIEAAAMFRIL